MWSEVSPYTRIGDLYRRQGLYGEASSAYQAAEGVLSRYNDSRANDIDGFRELQNCRIRKANLARSTGDFTLANKMLVGVVSAIETSKQFNGKPELSLSLATAQLHLANSSADAGDIQKGFDLFNHSITNFKVAKEYKPDTHEATNGLIEAHAAISWRLIRHGDREVAKSHISHAMDLITELIGLDGESLEPYHLRAKILLTSSSELRLSGRPFDAVRAANDAANDCKEIQTRKSSHIFQHLWAVAQVNLANAYFDVGASSDAMERYTLAATLLGNLYDEFQDPAYLEDYGVCCTALAMLHCTMGKSIEAQQDCTTATQAFAALCKSDPQNLGYLTGLVHTEIQQARIFQQDKEFSKAHEQFLSARSRAHQLVEASASSASMQNLAGFSFWRHSTLLAQMKQAEDALEAAERAESYWEAATSGKTPAPQHLYNFAWFLANCAVAERRQPERAIKLADQANSLAPSNAAYLNCLAAAYFRAGRWDDCRQTLMKAVEARPEGVEHGRDWLYLAMVHQKLEDSTNAQNYYSQGIKWVAENQPRDPEILLLKQEATDLLQVDDASGT